MKAKKLTLDDVEITVTPEYEEISPRSMYAVPGIVDGDSPEADDFVASVEEMIDKHGLWGWCSVRVTAKLGTLEGVAYMGGCSYENEVDFRNPGGYFPQMLDEALEDLQTQIDELAPLICCEDPS